MCFARAALAQTIQERVKSSAENVGKSWSCSMQSWGCTKGFWSIWEAPQTFTGTSVLYGHGYNLHAWYSAGFRLTLHTQDCNSSRPLVPEQALNNAYIPQCIQYTALQMGYKGWQGLSCYIFKEYFTRLWNKGTSLSSISHAKNSNTTKFLNTEWIGWNPLIGIWPKMLQKTYCSIWRT